MGLEGDRHAELHRERAGDGRADGRDVHRHGPAGAVAAGRGRPRERARHLARHRRRLEPDVQRAHGHLVLGPRAVARRGARLPAERVRARRAALRARHLEHEGRARLLRRGGPRAPGRRGAARRRRARRRGLRRDREGAVGRRAGRRVPRVRRGIALPRLARRRRRHVPARRADRVEARPRPFRLAVAADLDPGQLHPHRLQRGQARPELDPAHARGARRRARVDPDLGERPGERLPRSAGDRQRRGDPGRLRLARLADAASHRPLPRRPRASDEVDGDRALAGARHGARDRRSASRTTASRPRST